MPNEFITPKQMVDRMIAAAVDEVATMSIESLRKLANTNECSGMGFSGAIAVSLIIAAKKRLASMGEA